jgi:hypothetical protein
MRRLAQVEADEASEFPPEVRLAPPPAVVARYPRPFVLYRPCTAVRTSPAHVTHARAHTHDARTRTHNDVDVCVCARGVCVCE